jgi:ferritin-like metal-binding protein YciE
MTAFRSPEDILTIELKEIYSAERQLSRAIPKLTKKVASDRLRQMLEQRREQGAELIQELDETFDAMDVTKARPKNVAAEGLLEDVNQHLDDIEDKKLVDAVLLASMQKVEHYCIAAWGTAASVGRLLGQQQVVKTMERVLDEGKQFDAEMTKLAESEVNPRMLEEDESEESEEKDRASQGSGRSSRQRSN